MTQIMLVDSDKQVITILRAKLQKKYGLDVIVKDSAAGAISLLQILSEIELIITKDIIGKDQTSLKLCAFMAINKADFEKEIPILIMGENRTGDLKAHAIDHTASLDYIVEYAGFMLGLAPAAPQRAIPNVMLHVPVAEIKVEEAPLPPPKVEEVETTEEEYIGLNTKYYLNLEGKIIPFDSFTRAKRKDKGHDYSVKIAAGVEIEKSGIERLVTRGVAELFVRGVQFGEALKYAQNTLMEKIQDASVTGLDRVQLSCDVFDLSLDLIKHQGHDQLSMGMIKEMVKTQYTLMSSSNAFALFNNGLKLKNLSYGFTHLFLTNILMFKFLPSFEWGTDELKEKIGFVIYTHDLGLHNHKLIKAHHHYFRDGKSLSPEELQIVLLHAQSIAAAIMETSSDISPDIVRMIKEHHGIKSGKGFSESLSIIISPLAMSLLTVEEFVTRYLDISGEITPEHISSIFTEMEKKFNKQTYVETLKLLQQTYK